MDTAFRRGLAKISELFHGQRQGAQGDFGFARDAVGSGFAALQGARLMESSAATFTWLPRLWRSLR